MKLPRLRRAARIRCALLAVGGLAILTGCTPEEIALFQHVTSPYADVISDDQLLQLRQCESSDNYAAVGGGGRYRGAYQFTQGTWNRVANSHFPWLADQDPATVEPWWQDAMARALWSESGAKPWPHCGRKL